MRDRGDLTDAAGAGGLASPSERPTAMIAALLGSGDRDWNNAASGVRPALAAGLLRSVARLMNLGIGIPDHTTLLRRGAASLAAELAGAKGSVHVVIDSTGLKVYGAGEWHRQTYGGRDRRTWRKLHLAVDPDSGEILASDLTDKDVGDPSQIGNLLDQITSNVASVTADGAYDGEPVYRAVADRAPEAAVVIPPRAPAKASAQADQAPTQRDRHIQTIARRGRRGWQRATGYGRRSLVETAMFLYKTLIGRRLRARSLPGQKAEARMGCVVINQMTRLGMPVSRRVA